METILKKKMIIVTTVVAILFVLFRVFFEPHRLFGDCMEPCFKDGGLYFLNRFAPHARQYQIGDVVSYQHEGKGWISRIVALENDSIQIIEGNIIVNGKPIEDDARVRRSWLGWQYGTYALGQLFQIPPKHVYMLSDKLSAQHDDSRVFGPIHKDTIQGIFTILKKF